ncbi:MAG: hypothetical protein RI973_2221, partial [Bacteroidota bacterium]
LSCVAEGRFYLIHLAAGKGFSGARRAYGPPSAHSGSLAAPEEPAARAFYTPPRPFREASGIRKRC